MSPPNPIRFNCDAAVISVAVTPGGDVIVAGAVDRRVYLLDKCGSLLTEPYELDNEVWAVAVDHAGSTIVAGTACKRPSLGVLHCFEANGMRTLRKELGAPVWGVDVSPSGETVVASTWRNEVIAYRRSGATFELLHHAVVRGAEAGCYGISLITDDLAVVAAYDIGLIVIELSTGAQHLTELRTGIYNIAVEPRNDLILVGLRDGSIGTFVRDGVRLSRETSSSLTERPISAVACAEPADLLLAGSFDGSLHCVSRDGRHLWHYGCDGELWSVAATTDASLIVAGAGDGYVYILSNSCTAARTKELMAMRDTLQLQPSPAKWSRFASCCIESAAVDLLISELDYEADRHGPGDIVREYASMLARKDGLDPDTSYATAQLLFRCGDFNQTIAVCQRLSRDPDQQSRALQLAGDSFEELGLRSAAESIFRRATESLVNGQGVRLLYDLARSYEERGDITQALAQYEFLLSWDVSFRDARRRYEALKERGSASDAFNRHLDYTGLTVSMLGPDVPRDQDVDVELLPVLEARLKELAVPGGDRTTSLDALKYMGNTGVFESANLGHLPYDPSAYIKYEYSPLEDTCKKHLEMVNFLASVDLAKVQRTLDIGTATCRWPQFLSTAGVVAWGIDISASGFIHMRGRGMAFNSFAVGDGSAIPFPDETFDLVTCMMGTMNHIPAELRPQVLLELNRVLRPGGVVACSVWDTRCSYQSFLTMYSSDERAIFRRQQLDLEELSHLVETSPLGEFSARRFCCFPDQFVYDLGSDRDIRLQLEQLIEVDFAMRGRFPHRASQMCIVVAQKMVA